jgi:SAM-dependent methyltransferase
MNRRVDFSQNAHAYDRRHGAVLSASLATNLVEAAQLGPGFKVLDVGAGTGRVAIALAALGCGVVALDPSRAMLDVLQDKVRSVRLQPDRVPIHLIAAEGSRLPFADSSFDVVVLARILYLMPDWREVLSDIARALKPHGQILHEWGNGTSDEEWVQIRERARMLFEEAGVANPFHPGARSESEVDEFLAGRGFAVYDHVRVNGDVYLTLADFMARITNGECSYTWDVPSEVQRLCLPRLEEWVAEHFALDQALPIPREFSWTIYRR